MKRKNPKATFCIFRNEWKSFNPRTNVFWLHCLAYSLFLMQPRSIVTGIKKDRRQILDEIFSEDKVCAEFECTFAMLSDPKIHALLEMYARKENTKENLPPNLESSS